MRLHQSPLISLDDFLILFPIQVLGFGLLAIRPRSIRPAGRYLWPIPTAMWAFYWLTLLGQHSGIGRLTPVIAALVFLPLAPSLALGIGIDWLLKGVGYLTYPGGDGYPLWTVEFLACLPVVLLAVGVYRHGATSAARGEKTYDHYRSSGSRFHAGSHLLPPLATHLRCAASAQVAGECFRHLARDGANDPNGDNALTRLGVFLAGKQGAHAGLLDPSGTYARATAWPGGPSSLQRLPSRSNWGESSCRRNLVIRIPQARLGAIQLARESACWARRSSQRDDRGWAVRGGSMPARALHDSNRGPPPLGLTGGVVRPRRLGARGRSRRLGERLCFGHLAGAALSASRDGGILSGVFERFTERARQVVVLAQEEARALEHNYIGDEHILLGLLREEDGLAARVLESFKVTVERVRVQVVRIAGRGEQPTSGQIPFTPRAKKVLELALRESLDLGHNYIGTEHILLGLTSENEGVAVRILLDFDAGREKLRAEMLRMLSGPGAREQARSTAIGGRAGRHGIDQVWLDGLGEALDRLAAEIRDGLKRAPDTGDLLLVLASAPNTVAAQALRTVGVNLEGLAGKIEQVRAQALSAEKELTQRLEEMTRAMEQASEAQRFESLVQLKLQQRELRRQAQARKAVQHEVLQEIRRRLGIPSQTDDPSGPHATSI
jgi:hypothetical protein